MEIIPHIGHGFGHHFLNIYLFEPGRQCVLLVNDSNDAKGTVCVIITNDQSKIMEINIFRKIQRLTAIEGERLYPKINLKSGSVYMEDYICCLCRIHSPFAGNLLIQFSSYS